MTGSGPGGRRCRHAETPHIRSADHSCCWSSRRSLSTTLSAASACAILRGEVLRQFRTRVIVELAARRASWNSTLAERTWQPAQAPPSSARMVCECGRVASGSASSRTVARSSAVELPVGEGIDRAGVGCVWRQRGTGAGSLPCSRLMSRSSGARRFQERVAGADVFSSGCSRLPLVVSSTGAGGWGERAYRLRGRRRSADSRLRCRWPSGRTSDRGSGPGKPVRAWPRSAAFPVGVDAPGDG